MTTRKTTAATRVESLLLAAILATVAVAAGWASFTHVHDWTMRHAPVGTPDAFGWVNALISELVPVASFLTIRRRRRLGHSITYPLTLLIAAALLSLAAQLAVAQPSLSGWLLSAVPALAFMALVKLIFTTPATRPEPVPASQSTLDISGAPAESSQHHNAPQLVPSTTVPTTSLPATRVNGTPVIGQVTR